MGALVAPLLRRNRFVIGIDGDAHGDSPGSRTNPIAFAAKLLAASQELGPLDAVIGHSFGAAAIVIAISIGMQVTKMVYIAGPSDYRNVLENVGLHYCDFRHRLFRTTSNESRASWKLTWMT